MQGKHHTALVTGALSGMGVEFARVLAARGADLILTARRQDRLERLKTELQSAHQIQVAVIPADLSSPDDAEKLFAQVQALGRPVNVLVNNAGFGLFGPFLEQTPAEIEAMIQVNLVALTTLTRLFAEPMRKERYGYILQNSSYAGLQPIPRYAVYSAAKAYVIALGQTLRYELRKCGIQMSVLCPGFTHTEFHDVANHQKTRAMRFLSLTPRQVAEAGVKGLFRGKAVITPGLYYRLNNFVLRFLPRGAASALSAAVVKN